MDIEQQFTDFMRRLELKSEQVTFECFGSDIGVQYGCPPTLLVYTLISWKPG
jgi:hypothetical protein